MSASAMQGDHNKQMPFGCHVSSLISINKYSTNQWLAWGAVCVAHCYNGTSRLSTVWLHQLLLTNNLLTTHYCKISFTAAKQLVRDGIGHVTVCL